MNNTKQNTEPNAPLSAPKIVKKVEINTWYNRTTTKKETSTLPSLTVPDQAMSVTEILHRFARGQSLPQTRQPNYSEDDFSDLEKLDKFEKLDLLQENLETIKNLQEQMSPPTEETTKTSGAPSEPVSAGSQE